MHQEKVITAGKAIALAKKVLIMIHGRGGSANDILSLARHLKVKDFALVAPQATNHTWYPYSFLVPSQKNEPWLSSAIEVLTNLISRLVDQGFATENIYILGFSQGACLTLEFAARNAAKYGGIVAFTGGLIGDKITETNYIGSFENTPVYIGCGDPDPHVPVERVNDSADILRSMDAKVTVEVFTGMGHTISPNEIVTANRVVFEK